MPMYDWKCSECGADIAVIKPSDEGGEPPSLEDVAEQKVATCHAVGGHQWRKVYGAVIVARGANWGYGSKGNW